jgi:hypothetical protein
MADGNEWQNAVAKRVAYLSELQRSIAGARVIAADIRRNWDRYKNESERERSAATLLLTLADELERLEPALRPEQD